MPIELRQREQDLYSRLLDDVAVRKEPSASELDRLWAQVGAQASDRAGAKNLLLLTEQTATTSDEYTGACEAAIVLYQIINKLDQPTAANLIRNSSKP